MPAEVAQLGLPVHLRDEATLDNFLFPDALEALADTLRQQTGPEGNPGIFLYGAPGSGRTHLLQAACQDLPAGDALYLPLSDLRDHGAAGVLEGVEHLALACLDDIQAVAGDADWEQGLFHLINRARESGCRLLFSADRAPRQLDLVLPDLQSRLSWDLVFQLPEPDDARKLAVLVFRAERRGMVLSDDAARFILSRAPRGMGDLMAVLEQLDRDSMAAQRQLTIPFIKQRLGW